RAWVAGRGDAGERGLELAAVEAGAGDEHEALEGGGVIELEGAREAGLSGLQGAGGAVLGDVPAAVEGVDRELARDRERDLDHVARVHVSTIDEGLGSGRGLAIEGERAGFAFGPGRRDPRIGGWAELRDERHGREGG